MTLTSYVRVTSPNVTPRAIFDQARSLIGATEEFTWRYKRARYCMQLGQGLPALMHVQYGPDGPMPEHDQWCDEEDRALPDGCSCGPQAFIEVYFDTAYAYRADNGADCNDLHAYLITQLGQWLDQRSATWAWMTDTWCDWHAGWTGLEQTGRPEWGAPDLPAVRTLDAFAWPAATTSR